MLPALFLLQGQHTAFAGVTYRCTKIKTGAGRTVGHVPCFYSGSTKASERTGPIPGGYSDDASIEQLRAAFASGLAKARSLPCAQRVASLFRIQTIPSGIAERVPTAHLNIIVKETANRLNGLERPRRFRSGNSFFYMMN